MCKAIVWVFAALYIGALALLLIGTFGWFGQEKDPLSGVFLVPLGLPWNMLLGGVPDILRAWLAALSPLVNLALLAGLCRIISARADT